jgi:CDP-diacylglycerol--glycerol-3-phosphate 3-phosphatidyltransferase
MPGASPAEGALLARSLKPHVLALLRPLTTRLARGGIHPNALTLAGFGISCVSGGVYSSGPLAWAAATLLFAGLFDLLDGAVARAGQRTSRFGAFLDSNVDRFAEIVVFVGILWRFRDEPLTAVAVLLAVSGSLMVSYTKARAEGLGVDVSGGLLQRPERIVLLALGTFFGEAGLRIVVWVLAVLTLLTSVQRMILVAGLMAENESPEQVDSGDIEAARPRV